MQTEALEGGFGDTSRESAQAFRRLLEATARPGTVQVLTGVRAPAPVPPAAAAVLLTLCDRTTAVWLAPSWDTEAVRAWIAFHTGAPVVADASAAAFLAGPWSEVAARPEAAVGTPEYPDRSATLIAGVDALAGATHRLTGPGIRDEVRLALPEAAWFRRNRALFPLGLDVLLCAGERLAAVPRSTRVEEVG